MLELILGPGIFWFCWKPLEFFEVKIFASIRSSPSLELLSITSPPPPNPLPPLPRALSLFSRSPYILKASRTLVLFRRRSSSEPDNVLVDLSKSGPLDFATKNSFS